MRTRKTINTVWEVWTYDVLGNAEDGYEVNDRYCQSREYPLRLKITHNNVGTPHAFDNAAITGWQLQQVFGVRCAIDVDGDDTNYYVNRASDGYPIGEVTCVSHGSLSPLRLMTEGDS